MTNLTQGSFSPPSKVYSVGADVLRPELVKSIPAATGSPGPIVIYDRATSEKIDRLLADIHSLSQRMAAIENENAELPVVELRELSDAEAKREIRVYFECHDGETLYPSDVAEELMIDYDQVKMMLAQLEAEGAVAKKE